MLCLGDIVGYGPNPNECVAADPRARHRVILGNHDVAAIDDHGLTYFNPAAREAIEWTQGVSTPSTPPGSTGSRDECACRTICSCTARRTTTSNTSWTCRPPRKRSMRRTRRSCSSVTRTSPNATRSVPTERSPETRPGGGTLELESGTRYLINAGSVGQPRDLNPEASFVIYDSEARTVELGAGRLSDRARAGQDRSGALTAGARRAFERRKINSPNRV